MIHGIAFDLEGTVVNNEVAHHLGWIRVAGEIGVTLRSPEDAINKIPNFIGGPDGAIIEQIFGLLGTQTPPTVAQAMQFLASKWKHYDALVKEIDLSPRDGFLEVLGRLRCKGIPVCIGTAVELERGLTLLRRSGLDKLFTLHEIVLVTDVAHSKPAPDCFLETARRMRVAQQEQLVFEDSPRGVMSGVAAGSPVIAMPTYKNEVLRKNLLGAGAREVCLDWRELNLERIFAEY